MLDIKEIRSNIEGVKAALKKRNKDFELEKVLDLDTKWRQLTTEVEELKSRQNKASDQIGILKKEGKDASAILAEMKTLAEEISGIEHKAKELEVEIEELLLWIPNTPADHVPEGADETANKEVRRWGDIPKFAYTPLAHWEIGTRLGILDFERAAKVTGARFVFHKGLGARLERALINFMLDAHIDNGYTEIFSPIVVNHDSLKGTGHVPKFVKEEGLFKLEGTNYYLNPTAEVAITNLHRNEILNGAELPICYAGYCPSFRAEAGAAGKDTRGIIRQHQFNKVEMVKFARPEDSYKELESMLNDAERILQALEIPYRVITLCGGDLGFSSAMTYDIEVWMPSYDRYVEVSSCSNFEDFQARRANVKFKDNVKDKAQLVHTLNGSGLALPRLFAAILENGQQQDGSVVIPKALVKYLGVSSIDIKG